MYTIKKAIESRYSVRKFRKDKFPNKYIDTLLEAARLAPSGCNSQPWRFKITNDKETKIKLSEAVYNQKFIINAPTIIICCASLSEYLQDTISGIQHLKQEGICDDSLAQIIFERNRKREKLWNKKQYGLMISMNVNLAIENILLTALDLGLGSCYVGALDNQKVRDIFGWDYDIFPVALLPIGYPDGHLKARQRKNIKELLI